MRRAASAPALLDAALAALEPNTGWVVAFSGGLDSSVLLHLVRALRPAAAVRVLHVDHGWHPDSPRWAAHCRAVATTLGCPVEVLGLPVDLPGGQGREGDARRARYAALAAALRPDEVLLTAHHAEDQAETFLLMALRGSGLPGLAAMPAVTAFGPGRHARPLLGVPRAALAVEAQRLGLTWLEDPSNADLGRDRNLLRARILPELHARWPAVADLLGRSARHAAEAQGLLDDLADRTLADLGASDASLDARGLAGLSASAQRNLLRRWVRRAGLPPVPGRELARIQGEALGAAPDRLPCIAWPGAEVRAWRGRLYALRPQATTPPGPWNWDLVQPLDLAGVGQLRAEASPGPGLGLRPGTPVEVRWRTGGERLRLHPGGPRRALKDLLNEAGVPPWERGRLPLVFQAGRLVAVADRWLAAEATATPGLALRWAATREVPGGGGVL